MPLLQVAGAFADKVYKVTAANRCTKSNKQSELDIH
jgi:hypothetical protein